MSATPRTDRITKQVADLSVEDGGSPQKRPREEPQEESVAAVEEPPPSRFVHDTSLAVAHGRRSTEYHNLNARRGQRGRFVDAVEHRDKLANALFAVLARGHAPLELLNAIKTAERTVLMLSSNDALRLYQHVELESIEYAEYCLVQDDAAQPGLITAERHISYAQQICAWDRGRDAGMDSTGPVTAPGDTVLVARTGQPSVIGRQGDAFVVGTRRTSPILLGGSDEDGEIDKDEEIDELEDSLGTPPITDKGKARAVGSGLAGPTTRLAVAAGSPTIEVARRVQAKKRKSGKGGRGKRQH
ncbi:hypothetical protein CBOM_05175 [Ceraceosorus bombacis]|uniref:Uncharacterized protein n=1 Tax=Ceraceosorus bombacis TaxID=401625 RepID=A0A0P1BIL2_9BASI|nr:hypothetical protein CBOM_05175 [Ceraceosorus bombacis]